MLKKHICAVSIVFLLGMACTASADLVAHWAFDDGAGNTASDSVDNAHPGTIGGTANWVAEC